MHIFADFSVFASMELDSKKNAITRKFIISKIRKYIICATEHKKMRALELVHLQNDFSEHEQT